MTSRIINHHGNVEEVSAPAFTPGPWRWELSRHTKRIALCGGPRFDYTVVSFERYGMSGAAPVFWSWENNLGNPQRADSLAVAVTGREHHADWFADVDHPNARLIAAAPDGFEAGEEAIVALNAMMDAWFDYHDSHSLTQPVTGAAGNAFDKGLAAREKLEAFIAKARGEQQ